MCVVSEPVVEDATEQATDPVTQVEDAAPAEPIEAAVGADAPSDGEAVDSEAVPEAVIEAERPDLSSLTREQLRELRPDILDVESNAAVQRERDKLRKDAGSAEGARRSSEEFLRRVGVDPASVQDQSGLDFIRQNTRMNVNSELQIEYIKEAAEQLGLPHAEVTALTTIAESSDPEQLKSHTRAMITAIRKNGDASKRATLKLSDVTEEEYPVLYREIQAQTGQAASDERTGAAIKAKSEGKQSRPATSQAQSVGSNSGPTAAEYKAATRDQRAQWRTDGVEPRAE